jgi:hypothetical protein
MSIVRLNNHPHFERKRRVSLKEREREKLESEKIRASVPKYMIVSSPPITD